MNVHKQEFYGLIWYREIPTITGLSIEDKVEEGMECLHLCLRIWHFTGRVPVCWLVSVLEHRLRVTRRGSPRR